MKDISYIKENIEAFNKLEDKAVLQFILDNKEELNKNGMQILIDNDCVDLYFGEDSNEEALVFSFDTFGYELLNELFQVLKFDSDFV